MNRYSRENIFFTGTKKSFERTVYSCDKHFYVKWYGQMIEVEQGFRGYWKTVLAY